MTGPHTAQAAFLLAALCRLALAGIFLQSAWHALRDIAVQHAVIAAYRLLPPALAPQAAWIVPVLNLTAAALLLVPATGAIGALLGAALLAVFAAAMGINLRRGRVHIECGCGGAGQRISSGLVIRNVALTCVLLAAAAAPARGAATPAGLLCILGGAAGLAMLYFAASQLLANLAAFRAAGIAP